MTKWGSLGWEGGYLRYPTSDEIVHADGVGRRQEFQGGAIYVSFAQPLGAAITGAIRDKWNTVGAETPGSLLGYPTSDEVVLPGGQGRMNRFERGVIYWSPTTNAHTVTGLILAQWSLEGYEQSRFGYPTTDAESDGFSSDNLTRYFQFNKITIQLAVPAAGQHIKTFQPQDPAYDKTDRYARFASQVNYNFDPEVDNGKYFYPMTWTHRLNASAQALAATNKMTCQAYLNRFGVIVRNYYDNHPNVPIDYIWHSTISKNDIGAQYDLFGYCGFDTKEGGYAMYQFSFEYQVLDCNLPPPTGATVETPPQGAFESELNTG